MGLNSGKVFLVGAGPGDYRLITCRGKDLLAAADVVVYDRLIDPRLLALARPQAELLYVGKGGDGKGASQEEINDLLVAHAGRGKMVVRLKGGDPFLFGRGGEEAETLVAAGIPFEVVPGVTSALSVPAYAGIPVTHRRVASSVHVVTGHEDPGKQEDTVRWSELASSGGTIVVLMGIENIRAITGKLVAAGLDPSTPAALIQRGTTAAQRCIVDVVGRIAERAVESDLRPPVVMVVGEVVRLRDRLAWREGLPLSGRRILVTRPSERSASLTALIESLGGEAWTVPAVRIVPRPEPPETADVVRGWGSYRWIVLTSPTSVEIFFSFLAQQRLDLRRAGVFRLAAVGRGTAEALGSRGLFPDVVPDGGSTADLAPLLASGIEPGDGAASCAAQVGPRDKLPHRLSDDGPQAALLPRGNLASRELQEALAARGMLAQPLTLYDTLPETLPAYALEALAAGAIDAAVLTSPSGARVLAAALNGGAEAAAASRTGAPSAFPSPRCVCIGEVTAEAARSEGLDVRGVAARPGDEEMVGSLIEILSQE